LFDWGGGSGGGNTSGLCATPGGALAKGPDFLQLRGTYHVSGKAGGQAVDFTAPGAAETFGGR